MIAVPHSYRTIILANATATGAGATFALAVVPGSQSPPLGMAYDVVLTVAGGGSSPSAWVINLEGSDDGTNWTILSQNSTVANAVNFTVNEGLKFVRANITTLTGGSNFTVTVGLVTA